MQDYNTTYILEKKYTTTKGFNNIRLDKCKKTDKDVKNY
jgi:hypothetical protein